MYKDRLLSIFWLCKIVDSCIAVILTFIGRIRGGAGYGVMIDLFVGGLTFFGYVAALIIGGDIVTTICTVIYKNIFPVIIYSSVIMVLLGLVSMYLSGEVALTPEKKHAKNTKAKYKTKKAWS